MRNAVCVAALMALSAMASGVVGCGNETGSSGGAGGTTSAGGRIDTGGSSATGGSSSVGGVSSGGGPPASGASSTGGTSSGGANTGGKATGGTATGGTSSGGASTGGKATGGTTTGGASSGGASTGGKATGGTATGGKATGGTGGACSSASANYDQTVLCDRPVAFWGVNKTSGGETDLTGNGNTGTYVGGTPPLVSMPNGDQAADFNGSSQYLTIPPSASFSIPTTGNLTWEAWMRPDVLQFPHDDGVSGYVDWMGKCEQYGPTCEWEARMYSTNTQESPNRPNRISAYVFNPSAGLGSAADWQPIAGLIQANRWYHVVGEYTTLSQPADCSNAASYPGSINVWVNGVAWNHSSHGQTGCMSQYSVVPRANNSAVNIATMAGDSWFAGAIGKVAIYNYLLTQAQITSHYQKMTGQQPTGSCANTCAF
jgi:hypothetical protein